jgi:hypothetical protein
MAHTVANSIIIVRKMAYLLAAYGISPAGGPEIVLRGIVHAFSD